MSHGHTEEIKNSTLVSPYETSCGSVSIKLNLFANDNVAYLHIDGAANIPKPKWNVH